MIASVGALYIGFLILVATVSITGLLWIAASNLVLVGSVAVVDLIGRDR